MRFRKNIKMGIQVVSETNTISKIDTYKQIMFEIQTRMVDIEMNREQKKEIHNEVADMVHLVNKLSDLEGVDNTILNDRKEKIDTIFK
jgi:hypothetical protein